MFDEIKTTRISYKKPSELPTVVQKVIAAIEELNKKSREAKERWGVYRIEYSHTKGFGPELWLTLDRLDTEQRKVLFSEDASKIESIEVQNDFFNRFSVDSIQTFIERLEKDCREVQKIKMVIKETPNHPIWGKPW